MYSGASKMENENIENTHSSPRDEALKIAHDAAPEMAVLLKELAGKKGKGIKTRVWAAKTILKYARVYEAENRSANIRLSRQVEG